MILPECFNSPAVGFLLREYLVPGEYFIVQNRVHRRERAGDSDRARERDGDRGERETETATERDKSAEIFRWDWAVPGLPTRRKVFKS